VLRSVASGENAILRGRRPLLVFTFLADIRTEDVQCFVKAISIKNLLIDSLVCPHCGEYLLEYGYVQI